MKIVLYPHGGSGNHGCEAIVRATAKILPANYQLLSEGSEEDLRNGLDSVCQITDATAPIQPRSWQHVKALLQYYLLGNKQAIDQEVFHPVIKAARKADFLFSTGGDCYCYGRPAFIMLVNKAVRQQHTRTVLWGCSVEPSAMTGDILDDLKAYTHIIARESITYEAMKAHGLQQVSLLPDPAFQLNRIDLPLPEGFEEGNTVGVNVSPMIISNERNQGATLQNYIHLLEYIISNTRMQIALIPHVVWTNNDDRQPLALLYDRFKQTGRVVMLADHNAEQLKGYIARCRFMVTARTHASIAAYSSCVPTLVVGYSVKARGIATDLFGTTDGYVIPVQTLNHQDDLTNSFRWLTTHEDAIRNHLESTMSAYAARLLTVKAMIKKIADNA